MTISISVGDITSGFGIVSDAIAAVHDRLLDLPEDEKLLMDAVKLAVMFDPALLPLEVALPIAETLLNLLVEQIGKNKNANAVIVSADPAWWHTGI